MTAEIVIMNREAVALAADSAVTVGSGKIFNSANKVYMLAKGHSVGAMVYNRADFMGIPWEVIIKFYRIRLLEQKKTPFATLKDYAHDFIQFLEQSTSTLFPEEYQERMFREVVRDCMASIRNRIDKRVVKTMLSEARKISLEEVKTITRDEIDTEYISWSKASSLYPEGDVRDFSQKLADKYAHLIGNVRSAVFERLPISKHYEDKLTELCALLYCKDKRLECNSGIVLAGFGAGDLFPECVAYVVEGIVLDKLKYKQDERAGKIDVLGTTACIIPFAQLDVVYSFIEGIHPLYLEELLDQISQMMVEDFPQELVAKASKTSRISEEERQRIVGALADVGLNKLQDVLKNVQASAQRKLVDPILQTVTFLPKDELAAMAEALVTLTSFKRKVTMVTETVGGPIDVAVISKKDGFIWIKRKHYFDREYNAHFFT